MAKDSSKGTGGGANQNAPTAKKEFKQMNLEERKEALRKEKERLDKAFPTHYEMGKYTVYKIGNKYAAHQFRELSDRAIMRWQSVTYSAANYENTLKAMRKWLKQ